MVADPLTVGVLALQGEVSRHLSAVSALGARPLAVRRPDQLAEVDGLILPGGESTTMSMLLESSGLLAPLRHRLAGGMPAFGTCAGMILLAHRVLDGRPDQQQLDAIDITVRRNAFGRQVESFETDLEVGGLTSAAVEHPEPLAASPDAAGEPSGAPVHAVFIRAPLVEAVGPGVEVLATVDAPTGERQAVVCRQGPVLVAAFHPELSGEWRLHQWFVSNLAARVERQPAGIE